MMEASVISQDTGPLTEALETPSIPSSSALPQPSLTSKLPANPCRPKPQLPSRPPLPPSTPPSLLPPLPPVSKPPLSSSHSVPSLPPPLSPTPVSPPRLSMQLVVSSDLTPLSNPSPLPPQLLTPIVLPSVSPTPPHPPVIPSVPSTPQLLSHTDRLVGSTAAWQLKGINQDQITSVLEKETAGAFLVHSAEEEVTTLSLRLPDEQGPPLVHSLMVKQHKTFVHLDASSLVFDDIFKLISFYCASRDILAVQLRLPRAITMATTKEELEVISTMGADFWTSDLNQKDQDVVLDQNSCYLYVNPVTIEESPDKGLKSNSFSKLDTITDPNTTSCSLQNGEAALKENQEETIQNKTIINQEIKYKRPPPRPPSLSFGSGMGLLFSSPPPPHTSSSVTPTAVRKEEGRGGGGDREERKSMSPSPTPSRPPVPLQSRAAPPLPPAPVRRTSARKRTEQEVGEGTERERGQNPAGKTEKKGGGGDREEEKLGSKPGLPGEDAQQENSGKKQEEEVKQDKEKKEKEDDKEEKEVKINKDGDKQKYGSQCPSLVKKPSRPVPPPRRKPCSPDAPVGLSQAAGGGSANQSAGMRVAPPSPARRPDVSLYSPQGSAVMTADPDSCSTSSAEEDGELNQEHEENHSRPAESRSPKAVVKRTPTTIMLDKARYRLSTVITGLISHERRLTQRLVQLGRDPLSYFGNLVKEHRAFTLETMSNHSSTTELLQEIRQMMTQLKSYLLQSTELQAMLEPQHQYAQDKLESIVEAALCKSVLKPIREPIYQCLEKLHTSDTSLKQLTQNQSVVLGSTTTALGITTAVPEASAMEKISIKLNKLHLEYSPQKKIDLLLKTCKIIYDSMSVSSPGRSHGADDFLPVMMYVLARCNLSALQLDVEYMMELMDPSLTIGEGSYYLTTTYGALEHIKTFDQQRSATRQLSREVQDSIHRWERRRTLIQERTAQGSVRDFLTVCCPEIGTNPKTLGVLPATTVEQLSEQCAARFEQDCYTLSVYIDGVKKPLVSTDLALSVKNSCQPGAYCFVYHPVNQPSRQPSRSCPPDPPPAPPPASPAAPPPASPRAPPPALPPAPPAESIFATDEASVEPEPEPAPEPEPEPEEESLISL